MSDSIVVEGSDPDTFLAALSEQFIPSSSENTPVSSRLAVLDQCDQAVQCNLEAISAENSNTASILDAIAILSETQKSRLDAFSEKVEHMLLAQTQAFSNILQMLLDMKQQQQDATGVVVAGPAPHECSPGSSPLGFFSRDDDGGSLPSKCDPGSTGTGPLHGNLPGELVSVPGNPFLKKLMH